MSSSNYRGFFFILKESREQMLEGLEVLWREYLISDLAMYWLNKQQRDCP